MLRNFLGKTAAVNDAPACPGPLRTETQWPLPPPDLELGDDEVHLFCADLNPSLSESGRVARWLSPDEKARAVRFHFERDRSRFIVRRGLLREILGRLTHVEPDRLLFSYPRGKPQLRAPVDGSDMHFSLAHSSNMVIFAVCRTCEIGIDLEQIRSFPDAELVVDSFFSERERGQWFALPQDQRMEAFFNCWTRKEAYLKANGDGIGDRLRQIEVTFTPGENAQIQLIADDPLEAAFWHLESTQPAPDYLCALAIRHHGTRVARWKYTY